ncbi:MAG: L-threonylcarbamoyladenylate synthase, partial [Candidatus Woesearchaeota archaeon]
MKIISRNELQTHTHAYIPKFKSGKILVYPTDTIYGIGCNALINASVAKIREIKGNFTTPFSIIVPDVDWIQQHCVVPGNAKEWLDKLPGPYTLIFQLKDPKLFSEHVTLGKDTIGVRIPDHWITEIVKEVGYPIITTSVNKMGRTFMTDVENLDQDIAQQIDILVEDGEVQGKPSTIVHLTGEQKIINR